VAFDSPIASPATLERCNGRVELSFQRRDGVTALAHLYQHHPCRVLFPRVVAGEPTTAVLLTTSGGLTGGDRVEAHIDIGEGARALVASQAAEKIYRSLGPTCDIATDVSVAAGAWCEWLPQETILFDGARLHRRTTFDVVAGARCVAAEMVVFGRVERGESFTRGSLFDRRQVSRDGRLVWVDSLALDGDIAAALARPAGFAGARAIAGALYIADDAGELLDRARDHAVGAPCRAGVTLVNGILVARFLDPDAVRVRQGLSGYLGFLRHAAAGLPATMPRVWSC
jgi:urease accessory protein